MCFLSRWWRRIFPYTFKPLMKDWYLTHWYSIQFVFPSSVSASPASVNIVWIYPRPVTVCSQTRLADRADLMKNVYKPAGRISKLIFISVSGEKENLSHYQSKWSHIWPCFHNKLLINVEQIIFCLSVFIVYNRHSERCLCVSEKIHNNHTVELKIKCAVKQSNLLDIGFIVGYNKFNTWMKSTHMTLHQQYFLKILK